MNDTFPAENCCMHEAECVGDLECLTAPSSKSVVRDGHEKMASVRTIDDARAELHQVLDEIKEVKQSIANPESDEDRVQDKIRLNHLYQNKIVLEAERMFPVSLPQSVSLIAHPCLFALFLCCASLFCFLPHRLSVRAQRNPAEVVNPAQSILGTHILAASCTGGSTSTECLLNARFPRLLSQLR